MATKFYGQSEAAAKRILDAFQNPNDLPAKLAPIFIRKNDDTIPCHKWSWSNQLITALNAHALPVLLALGEFEPSVAIKLARCHHKPRRRFRIFTRVDRIHHRSLVQDGVADEFGDRFAQA